MSSLNNSQSEAFATELWNRLVKRAKEIEYENVTGMCNIIASELYRKGFFGVPKVSDAGMKRYERASEWVKNWIVTVNPWLEVKELEVSCEGRSIV